MILSPLGRKKIAHRFIGGASASMEASPGRDERACVTGEVFSSVPAGTHFFASQPSDESLGYFREVPTGLRMQIARLQTARRFEKSL